ncbi:hypothetical protein LRAMOSA03359 [Lichtheimia ramosa]|uniref:Tubulin nucleotide-binding domain-like protein n=1 Tax=Lichtheimia ramosa TaxID=688394 RepID=A0A077WUV4_9FUNG|nr:hypothetical protein LRAMOSA03359 [Lichtheimia ramosa]
MREVITLQFGQLANYVGTHFWNTQEEYFNYSTDSNDNLPPNQLDHDVLYRAGLSSTGVETYTPRVLVYDLKGGFGSLNKYNALFAAQDEMSMPVQWEQGVNKVVSERYPKNAYQQQLDRMEQDPNTAMEMDAITSLDQSVKTWSDYNRIYYHPRSMNQITTHHMDDTINPFDAYTVGRQSFSDYERETESYEDNFRHFVEECDNLQGFQILAGVDDAFGGFTEGMLQLLREDFPKTPIMTYGLQSSNMPAKERSVNRIMLNRSLAMTRILDLSTSYIPLMTPTWNQIQSSGLVNYIHPNCDSLFHTSAILSAAIETVSLSWRLKKNPVTMADLTSKLDGQGSTKLSGLALALPLLYDHDGFSATVDRFKDKITPLLDLTHSGTLDRSANVFAEDVVVRGLPRSTVHPSDQGLFEYTRCLYGQFSHCEPRFMDQVPYPLPTSYPHFFSSRLNDTGYLTQKTLETSPSSVPILTRMYTGSELSPGIEQLAQRLQSMPFKQMTEYTEGDYGMSYSDLLEVKEDMMYLLDVYTNDDDVMLE